MAGNAREHPRRPWTWATLAVAVPLAVYFAVVAHGYDGRPYLRGDCPYYFLTGASLLEDRDLDLGNQLSLDPSRYSGEVALDRRGRLVPKHPIALPLASLALIGPLGPPGALLFNLIQLAALAALLYKLARRVAEPWAAAVATAVTGAASVLPHYAWNYSPDVFSTLLLTGALATLPPPARPCTRSRLAAAGLLLGLAVASKFPLIVVAPFFLLALPPPRRQSLAPFALGAALPLVLLAAYDTHLFGAPWVTSYDRIARWTGAGWTAVSQRDDFGDPWGAGLFRQLMDRRHGLVPTSLPTVLSFLGLPWLWRRWGAGAAIAAGGAAALLLFFATYRLWDHSHHGNRFLIPVVALAVLPLAPAVEVAGRRLATLRPARLRRTSLLFALVVAAQLVPVWSVDYVPTQDGPAHLRGASLLLDLHRADRPYLREVYELNVRPTPTWASHLVLASLLGTFPPSAAEKLFLSGYLVLFPFAVRGALRRIRPGAENLAFLALPLSASYLFHLGFYSFCWSLAVLAVAVGYWLRRGGALDSTRERLTFAGLGVLLWLCHPVTLAAAATAVAAGGCLLALRGPSRPEVEHGEDVAARLRRYCLVPILALSPALALVAGFAAGQPGAEIRWIPWAARLRYLATLDILASFERRELWLSGAMSLLLAVATAAVLRRRLQDRRLATADALLAAAAACLVLYLAVPDAAAGGGWISHRLLIVFVLLLVLWLGAQPLGGALRRACQVAPAILALGMTALHGAEYREISPYLREYTALAAESPPGAALLPMTSTPGGSTPAGLRLSAKLRPFVNAAGFAAAESESAIVLLNDYQAALPYFPVRYREPAAEPDLVLLWGPGSDRQVPGYVPVAISSPTGLGRLYVVARRRDAD